MLAQWTAQKAPQTGLTFDALRADDLPAAVAIDAALHPDQPPRPDYLSKRLHAAERAPKRHVQVAARAGGELAGFALGRMADGEFGGQEPLLLLETVAVAAAHQHRGVGMALLHALGQVGAHKGATAMATQLDWRDGQMAAFFAAAGFAQAPRQVLSLPIAAARFDGDSDDQTELPLHHCRLLRADDLPAIRRIDLALTGRDRKEFLARQVDEALHDSALRVSQVAVEDGAVVGFALARVDHGDFGRVAPAAVLHTLGIQPGFAAKRYGTALVAQLAHNLRGLLADELLTEVANRQFELLGWFAKLGFAPSQRVALQMPLKSA